MNLVCYITLLISIFQASGSLHWEQFVSWFYDQNLRFLAISQTKYLSRDIVGNLLSKFAFFFHPGNMLSVSIFLFVIFLLPFVTNLVLAVLWILYSIHEYYSFLLSLYPGFSFLFVLNISVVCILPNILNISAFIPQVKYNTVPNSYTYE